MSATKDNFSAVLSYVSLLEHIRRTVNIVPCILHLGTGWKVILSFTARSLYDREGAFDTYWTVD